MVKRPYQERPLRSEYRLTEKGADLWPVLVALLQWGDRYGLEGERPMILQHRGCGGELDDRRRCTTCGTDVTRDRGLGHPHRARGARAWRPAPSSPPSRLGRLNRPLPDVLHAAGWLSAAEQDARERRVQRHIATVAPMSDDVAWLDATAQAELVRAEEVSPAELVADAIARMEKLNPQLNAIIHELYEPRPGRSGRRAARRPVPWRALPLEGPRGRAGGHALLRGPGLRRRLPLDRDPGAHAALHRRGVRDLRQDEHARARDPPHHRTTPLRPLAQPLADRTTRPEVRRAGRPPRWRRAWCPRRTPTTAAGRSGSRRRVAGSSGSSRRADETRWHPNTAT